MDIYKHKDTVLKWVRSCQTAQQLDLFTRAVAEFDVARFHYKIELYEAELVKQELSDAIIEQRIILAGKGRLSQFWVNPIVHQYDALFSQKTFLFALSEN